MSVKNPLMPAGIEPATFRFVAQHLKHCATAVPKLPSSYSEYSHKMLKSVNVFFLVCSTRNWV